MSVNRAILIGNLGKDPELRYTNSGKAVASFSLATSEKYKDSNGEKKTVTEWHNLVAWGQLAEICSKYLSKGKQIYVEGKIQNRSYDDKDGNKRYISEIVVKEMTMLGSRADNASGGQQQQTGQTNQPGPREQQRNQTQGQQSFDPSDEIPF